MRIRTIPYVVVPFGVGLAGDAPYSLRHCLRSPFWFFARVIIP